MCCRSKHNITLYSLSVINSSSQLSTTLVAWMGKSSHPIVCSKTHESFATYRGCANLFCIVPMYKEGKKEPVVYKTSVNRTNNVWRVLSSQYPYIQRSKVLSLISKRRDKARQGEQGELACIYHVICLENIQILVAYNSWRFFCIIWTPPPTKYRNPKAEHRVEIYLNISDYM